MRAGRAGRARQASVSGRGAQGRGACRRAGAGADAQARRGARSAGGSARGRRRCGRAGRWA